MNASLRFVFVGAALAAASAGSHAQVATDGKLPLTTATNLSGPHYEIGAHLGRRFGTNLFHSFRELNLAAGQSATFFGTLGSETRNVLSRVTGGVSSIDGLIKMDRASLPGANLFLINPKGIIFGPNASLDLTGSFHASTADYIRLGASGRFDATDPTRDVLNSAAPAAFGFLGPNPAAISVRGSDLTVRNETASGTTIVRAGAGVSLIGGPVSISDATIHTIGADIRVGALAGSGEVPLTGEGAPAAGTGFAPVVVERSDVRTESGANAPGRIVIRGGSIRIADNTFVVSSNTGPADAPPISVHGTGDVVLSASLVESHTAGSGSGADLSIRGRNARVEQVTTIGTTASGDGKGGAVELAAEQTLSIVSTAADGDFNYVYAETSGNGMSGALRLSGDRLDLRAPYIYTVTAGAGDTGPIQLTARDASLVEGTYIVTWSEPDARGRTSAIDVVATERIHLGGLEFFGNKAEILALQWGSGHGHPIFLKAPEILVRGGNVESGSIGAGNAGKVRIEGDVVRFIAGDGAHARAASIVYSGSTGDGGNIEVVAKREFELNGNGFLGDWTHFVTASEGGGRGGDIVVQAPVVLIDRGTFFARTRFGTGASGGIRVEADTVTLRNEGGIGSVTETHRDGSSVFIQTRLLNASDTSGIGSDTISSGNAGSVTVQAQRVRLTGASGFGAGSAGGSGSAGSIVLDIGESFEMVERSVGTYQDLGGGGPRGSPVWPGGLNLAASGSGSGGSLLLRAPLVVLDDGRIRSTAAQSGTGGRVDVRADTFIMRNGAQIDAKSAPGSSGDAGSIDIQVTGRFEISGHSPVDGAFSGLYAQTQGSGRGGSIDVAADTFTLDRGLVRSSTAGSGDAGTIRIRAGDLALFNGGWVDAGTTAGSTGRGGNVDIGARRSVRVSGIDRTPMAPVAPPAGVLITPATAGRSQGAVASALSSNTAGSGAGGNVTVVAPYVRIEDGAHVSANSAGRGTAGDIVVDARPGSILIDRGSISTQAETSDGGNIALLAGNRVHVIGGEISTSVGSGSGSGGNIFVDPVFVILQNARAAANAFGGSGGNVAIFSSYFFASSDSAVEASSQLGVPGSVQISAVQSGVISGLPALPAQFFDASGLLREACARPGGASRLVDMGRGGVAYSPLAYASSRYFSDEPLAAPVSGLAPSSHPANPQSVLLAGVCRS